ncbi:hypothetical protein S245_017507, partial [Arachis hypogaea]
QTHRRIATHDGAAPLRRHIATTITTTSHRHHHRIPHPTAPLRRPTAPLCRRRAPLFHRRRQACLLHRLPYSPPVTLCLPPRLLFNRRLLFPPRCLLIF